MKYMKKNFTQIFFIFCVLILIAIPINIISISFSLRSYDLVDKEKLNPSDAFITTLNGKKYLAEYITREKVEEMKKQSELKISNKNYNQIIDGHGTGYAPPTTEDLEKLIGKVAILDVISDAGFQNYGASADISTEIYFPVVGDQAMQGSCTAWANAYYAYGYMEAKDYGWDASSGNTDYLLSPAWAYNKVAAYDYGSVPVELAQLIIDWGVSTLSTMPYNDFDVDSWGEEPAWREAPYHRPLNYNPIFFVGPTTIDIIKSLLDSGTPVTIGIDAYQYDPGFDDGNYIISSSEYDSSGSLNHAQCFVGYDDSITDDGDVGAFRVVNSWGLGWGDSGYYWLTYDAFSEFADDPYQSILYYTDRIDYNPSLVGTWEFSAAPTRMDDIITLGAGPYNSPLDTINPLYDNDIVNLFPEFMALDISDFQTHYNADPDVFFFLDVGPSTTTGIISSFLVERYVGGTLVEISPESLNTPASTPGHVNCTFKIFDHELKAVLELPIKPKIGYVYPVKATVTNLGINDETNVDLFLSIDGALMDSISISTLYAGTSETITYMWIVNEAKTFTFNAYAPPVPGETYISNNNNTIQLDIASFQNYIMVPGYTYSWIDASGGTELFLFDDDYAAIALPFSFTFYDQIFSTIYLCSNGYLSFTDTMPMQYYNVPFPSADPTHNYMIAPFWDDIYPPDGGHIYVQSFGTYWVAAWVDIYQYGGSVIGSFEVVLYDTGEIMFNYNYLDYTAGGYTCGLNLGEDTDYYNSYQGLDDLTDNFAIQFYQETLDFTHDLCVTMEVPESPEIDNTYIINATIFNTGNNAESNVDLILELDEVIVNSTTITSLLVGESETITYEWTPIDYGIYNFTAYAPPISGESFIQNNIATELLPFVEVHLFGGMYIDLDYTEAGSTIPTRFSYSFYSGSLFYESWDIMGFPIIWLVDSLTRLMSGGSVFGDGTHTPAWIFTHVSLGDQILIASDGDGDHLFEVSSELIYDLPGFGLIEVWELEDLTLPGGVVWYEKSTGILLNGTFYYNVGLNWYKFDFVDTNVEFTYYEPLSLTITTPDSTSSWETGTFQSITWTSTGSISDVKIELYENDVFVMEIVASTLNVGEFSWLIPTTLVDSTQYQIKISDVVNPATDDFSEDFEIFSSIIDSLTVTNPDSLTVWEMGTSQDITWTSTGTISDVKIELYKGGVFEREIIAITTNDGTYNWDIPTDLEDGIDYQIKISDVSNSATYGESPNFALTTADTGDGTPAIPGYNLLFLLGIIIAISVITIIKTGKRKLILQ